jgi:hypothetical protein
MKHFTKAYLEETFTVIKQLHKSDKSEILLVLNNHNKQLCVIKYINHIGLPYKDLKEIYHPLFPEIIYIAETSNQTIIIEEYISAQNLHDILQEKGSLDEYIVIKIVLQLCDGLKLLHKKNIIHRDIKPSNILLTNDQIAKLIDFDVARIEKIEAEKDTKQFGTIGYAPPEQYGFSQTDQRSDIYALGMTIKDLVGREYKGNLLPVIEKCTQLNPANRFQSISKLEQAIRKAAKAKKIRMYLISIFVISVVLCVYLVKFYFAGDTQQLEVGTLQAEQQQSLLLPAKTGVAATIQEDPEQGIAVPKKIEPEETKPALKDSYSRPALSTAPISIGKIKKELVDISFQITGYDKMDAKIMDYTIWFDTRSNWQKTEGALAKAYPKGVYFPPDCKITFEIRNHSDQDLIKPVLRLIGSNTGFEKITSIPSIGRIVNQDRSGALQSYNLIYEGFYWLSGTIPAGDTVSYTIAMEDWLIEGDHLNTPWFKLGFEAENYSTVGEDNYTVILSSINIYFKDDPPFVEQELY